ncbi:hypothetical protein [Streptomyces akebiae]|uniref:Uncharacterized protein n=2 Tax=Streptomyces TaxID=1883 RepID=A0ABX8XKL3_9ACTN|nr:hypothetical protein [Streptomyces akebiae]QYX76143.1 hypothetical protein K1J60_06165 [Streptomyces akebiae]
MNAIPPDAMQVRITPDGICFIDEEYFTPPPGASLNEAVLAHLQLEAAALEMPIQAVIQDEQAQYTTSIQVNTDGTSHPLDDETSVSHNPNLPQPTAMPAPPASPHTADPVPPDRPYEPLPEPYRGRLASTCATANEDRFTEAAHEADQLLAELSTQYGPSHLYTLAVALVRGDIAWLSQDYLYGAQIWIFMARSWHLHLGPQHGTTVRAVGNALGCWGRLQPEDAKASAPHVVKLLQDITIPNADSALRTINQWTQRIALAN